MSDPGTAHDGPETAPDGRSGSPEAQDTDLRYERFRAAVEAGFDGDNAEWVSERLNGETREELIADAQAMAQTFGGMGGRRTMATDPSQGRGNGRTAPKTETLSDTIRRMSGNPSRGVARG